MSAQLDKISASLDRVGEQVVCIREEQARQGTKLSAVDQRLTDLHDSLQKTDTNLRADVVELRTRVDEGLKTDKNFWRSKWVAIVIALLLGGGAVGGLSAYANSDTPPPQQIQEP